MSIEDYYPAGANTPDAPWNQSEPDEREFEVCISQTLSKSTSINTSDYYMEREYLDPEDGGYIDTPNTENVNWKEEYSNQHYTPLELIGMLKTTLEEELKALKGETVVKSYNEKKLINLINECSNWIEDETEIVEE